jgi:hypothetical protein
MHYLSFPVSRLWVIIKHRMFFMASMAVIVNVLLVSGVSAAFRVVSRTFCK